MFKIIDYLTKMPTPNKKNKIIKIAIYGKNFTSDFTESLKILFQKLAENKIQVFIYKPYFDFITSIFKSDKIDITGFFSDYSEIKKDTSFMLSIGGDGTYLEAVAFIKDSGIPIVGLNSGRLGFLANISKDNLITAIDDVINNRYDIDKRSLIKFDCNLPLFKDYRYALNEFTIHKKDSSSMIKIQAYINNEYLNTYWADGIIVATPTGSTAYSMSAGGPIATPDSTIFILSPLAPHNLTVRPLVIPDNCELRFRVEGRNTNYLVSLDRRSEVLHKSIDFIITRANFEINSIRLLHLNYFTTLRSKLMWGIDSRN